MVGASPQALLYQLVASQLQNDGFYGAASVVSEATMCPIRSEFAVNRLLNLMQAGMIYERENGVDVSTLEKKFQSVVGQNAADSHSGDSGPLVSGPMLDLDAQQPEPNKRGFSASTTRFITTHKAPCRVVKFSADGKYVATGSADTSIKLLEVSKMVNHSQTKSEPGADFASSRPVVRTFYDHVQPINDLDFHPFKSILISCSSDCTVKFFDFSKQNAKRAFRYLQDTYPVRSVQFHPSGGYLLAGTEHPIVRLYDVNTFQSYTSRQGDHHMGAINQVRYAPDAKTFVSCSKDGKIKLWDAINFNCIRTIDNAHSGCEVSSAQLSKSGKYVLSSGKDSTCRLWDVGTGRQLRIYNGALQQRTRMQCCFSYDENHVFSSDEKAHAVVVWDTRTGDLVQRMPGHNNLIRWIATSPTELAFMTASEDHRARFYYPGPA
eukprot:GFYU01016894.1.p1 GENE.GFYU01016894.1~~GFYU01016894.1.p1  ORF type:complete len:435 (+),score=74.40 GFYU01016894.1:55-1359(+)